MDTTLSETQTASSHPVSKQQECTATTSQVMLLKDSPGYRPPEVVAAFSPSHQTPIPAGGTPHTHCVLSTHTSTHFIKEAHWDTGVLGTLLSHKGGSQLVTLAVHCLPLLLLTHLHTHQTDLNGES